MRLFGFDFEIKLSYVIWTVAILSLGGMFYYASNSSSDGVDGVECSAMEYANYHVHANLRIYVNGEQRDVPANIGIFNTCLYWLHTHTGDGILHIEAPTKREYRFGQFMDIWNKTYGDPFADVDMSTLYMTVNGEHYEGDYRDLVLDAHQVIVMQFGEPRVEPEAYIFPPGL